MVLPVHQPALPCHARLCACSTFKYRFDVCCNSVLVVTDVDVLIYGGGVLDKRP